MARMLRVPIAPVPDKMVRGGGGSAAKVGLLVTVRARKMLGVVRCQGPKRRGTGPWWAGATS